MKKFSPEDIKKIEEWLDSKNEILNFALNKRILKIILFYLGIASIIFWIGINSYFNYEIKTNINKIMSEKIDEEYNYLSERNKITELGDLAVSTKEIKYYNNLKKLLNSKKQKRINVATEAELSRIENFFMDSGDEYCAEDEIKYDSPEGKTLKGRGISTEKLIEIFNKTDNFGKKTTILQILDNRYEKDLPDFFLIVASNTDNLRMRFVALSSFQRLLDNFSVNRFDIEANKQLWYQNKEDYYKRRRR